MKRWGWSGDGPRRDAPADRLLEEKVCEGLTSADLPRHGDRTNKPRPSHEGRGNEKNEKDETSYVSTWDQASRPKLRIGGFTETILGDASTGQMSAT